MGELKIDVNWKRVKGKPSAYPTTITKVTGLETRLTTLESDSALNSRGQTVYVQTTEPTDKQTNDIWIIP